jgi:hypothetical protein
VFFPKNVCKLLSLLAEEPKPQPEAKENLSHEVRSTRALELVEEEGGKQRRAREHGHSDSSTGSTSDRTEEDDEDVAQSRTRCIFRSLVVVATRQNNDNKGKPSSIF